MATAVKKYEYKVPRSFRLRQELEFAEKGVESKSSSSSSSASKPRDPHAGFVSFGLGFMDDNAPYEKQLSNWNGTIIGPQNTNLGDRIYTLRIKCGPMYPDEPPLIYFENKINMTGVDPNTGLVQLSAFLRSWNRQLTMYDYMSAIRTSMTGAHKNKQPPPDEKYPAPVWPHNW